MIWKTIYTYTTRLSPKELVQYKQIYIDKTNMMINRELYTEKDSPETKIIIMG